MPAEVHRALRFMREIEEAPNDALRELDRELLLKLKAKLSDHKREVDKALLRLSFVCDQQLN